MLGADATAQATIVGASIAAVSALVTATVAVVVQHRISSNERKVQSLRSEAEFRLQQMNRLYGPLILLRQQSKYYWEKLREGKGADNWRLLDNLDQVRSNPADLALAQLLVQLNTRSEKVILENAGLMFGPSMPDCFHRFLGHCGIVRVAVEQGRIPGAASYMHYPPDFDTELERGYLATRAAYEKCTQGDH